MDESWYIYIGVVIWIDRYSSMLLSEHMEIILKVCPPINTSCSSLYLARGFREKMEC